MEALTRSTMSPPKALNSKTTSDRVETRRRKKNTQWHVCPSLQHTHARTGPTASGCSPQKENTHSRRCLGNALRQKTNRNRHERNVQKNRKQKQPLWNNVDGTEYVTLIASNENVTWSETDDSPSVAAGTGGSIRACCRQLVGVQSYKHTSVKFCFPLSHFAFLSAWGRNMFCIASPQIGAVNILIRRIFMARFMVNTSSTGMQRYHKLAPQQWWWYGFLKMIWTMSSHYKSDVHRMYYSYTTSFF